jgi:hypothetical protein
MIFIAVVALWFYLLSKYKFYTLIFPKRACGSCLQTFFLCNLIIIIYSTLFLQSSL